MKPGSLPIHWTPNDDGPPHIESPKLTLYVDEMSYATDVLSVETENGSLIAKLKEGTTLIIAPGHWRNAHTDWEEG